MQIVLEKFWNFLGNKAFLGPLKVLQIWTFFCYNLMFHCLSLRVLEILLCLVQPTLISYLNSNLRMKKKLLELKKLFRMKMKKKWASNSLWNKSAWLTLTSSPSRQKKLTKNLKNGEFRKRVTKKNFWRKGEGHLKIGENCLFL